MKYENGQSLIELIIAIGVFSIAIVSLVFLILESYISGRLASEITVADFLAQEGLEAARAIRDNNWSDLVNGDYRLDSFSGNWRFIPGSEIIDGKFIRVIKIDEANPDNPDPDRKKITSQIIWQFSEGRNEEVKLVTYLTHWQKGIEIRKPTAHTDFAGRTTNDALAYDYPDGTTFAATRYDITRNPSITFHTWQPPTKTYTSLVLKYRYHAAGAIDDTYAVAYSLDGCSGQFTNLISPTSVSVPDTTISVNLNPTQNLSQLCLKIYTQRVGGADGRRIYTRDIWTEGTY